MGFNVEAATRKAHKEAAGKHVRALSKPGLTPQEAREHLAGYETAKHYGGLKDKETGMTSELRKNVNKVLGKT